LHLNLLHTVNRINTALFLRVIFSRYKLFAGVFILLALQAEAQDDSPGRRGSRIIDDTTKQIYGPNTSRYFFEEDVFMNREVLQPIDTIIRNFHRFNYVQNNSNLYQDLGQMGTAIQPIYYQTPDGIGVTPGHPVYDLYWDSESIQYYDTKSPYSHMRVILGGKGRSLTRASFSRNITPQWNFGFNFRTLYIDKQILRQGKGDRITRSNYYDLYSAFQTKDSTYRVFFNIRRMFHRVNEPGGIQLIDPTNYEFSDFFEENAQPWLTNAESNDLRINFHVFHQYKVGRALQLYHTFDRYRQKNNFLDVAGGTNDFFYDYTEIDTDSTRDVSKFTTVRNEVGIKGNLSRLFYNGYYAIRHYSMYMPNFNTGEEYQPYGKLDLQQGNESFLGGRIMLNLDSIGRIGGLAEIQSEATDVNYRIQGEIKSRWFEARVTQMRYNPGFVQQYYRGAHDLWINDFTPVESTQLNGYLHYNSSVLNISPGLTFTRLRNYVFYKQVSQVDTVQQVLPVQSSGNQVVASPELRLSLTFFRHVTFSAQAIYTKMIENADDALSVPDFFVNTQLAYSNIFFNRNLDMHAGIDLHWKSDYHAMGYDPAIRQFYIQDSFITPGFPVVDVFFNAKIKKARIFFKYHNLVQAFTKSGYLPTPYYPGQSNVFDFGFDWSFYD
jgi:hypothetical protein